MAVREGFEKLLGEGGGVGLRQGAVGDVLEEGARLAERENDGGGLGILEGVDDFENVGVGREEGHGLGLYFEAVAVGGVAEEAVVDDFESVELVGGGVEAAEDGAEFAATDFFQRFVLLFHESCFFLVHFLFCRNS